MKKDILKQRVLAQVKLMSSIGLYDADFIKYIHVPFNLEIMKLAAYWKRKRIITVLSPFLEPERYGTFIYRKDYNDNDFPIQICDKNVQYGGYAFSGEKYIPLNNEIELTRPDKYIYSKFRSDFFNNKMNSDIFKRMLNAEHLRISLDGKNIWKDFLKPIEITKNTHSFLFHDYDLNKISGSQDVIKDLFKEFTNPAIGAFIGTKFPIQVKNKEELFHWLDFRLMNNNFSIQYNGLMEDDVFCEFIERQKGSSLARHLSYIVTAGCSSENDFIVNRLPKIFNQAIFSRTSRAVVLLRYEDNFFKDKRWEKVIKLFNAFIGNILPVRVSNEKLLWRAIELETLYSFVKIFEEKPRFKGRIFSKNDARELFQFVREENYDVFKHFYDTSKVKLDGGILVNDTTEH